MPTQQVSPQDVFSKLQPGDRIEVDHEVKVGSSATWRAKTVGTVLRIERRQHGLHFRRSNDDKAFSDCIVLKRDDGELTTVTMDEFTIVSFVSGPLSVAKEPERKHN